jgi:hypothetical protein
MRGGGAGFSKWADRVEDILSSVFIQGPWAFQSQDGQGKSMVKDWLKQVDERIILVMSSTLKVHLHEIFHFKLVWPKESI